MYCLNGEQHGLYNYGQTELMNCAGLVDNGFVCTGRMFISRFDVKDVNVAMFGI
jgi:hypothetical protein